MGCLHAKIKKHDTEQEKGITIEVPKTYTWDKKEKVNPADFTIENISNREIGRLPGTISGQQFIIQNCQASQIYLFDHINTITVDDCSDCIIFVGPTTGSLFLRDCQDCVVMAACGQFRTRDCCKMDIFLLCQTQPIIEASAKMRFGCFQAFYPQLKDQFRSAGISVFNNNWSNIHDFTPVDGETNWSCVSQTTKLSQVFKLPEEDELKSVGMTLDHNLSIVPYTYGSPGYGSQEAALVIMFCDESQHQRAMKFISSLKAQVVDCKIQHSREVKMEATDAQRVFHTSEYKSAISQGPVIAFLCLGNDITQVCSTIGQEMNDASGNTVVYVTSDVNTSNKQIDTFFSYASMTMTM
ncbi:protein XRP2-like [Homarus americanus]|uniref:Protein XRP2 n=1 Tax=Homarus americanus TaxID=6706 RepID=A0A8J5N625_HOMAM|nr:protein XRP2-like [Homarus americanus]KAG7173772.1 XRP2-like [Homarus americanus]